MNETAGSPVAAHGPTEYDIEQRLRAAECRYARARERRARMREQYETLKFTSADFPEAVAAARERLTLASAVCDQARDEIAELERMLD